VSELLALCTRRAAHVGGISACKFGAQVSSHFVSMQVSWAGVNLPAGRRTRHRIIS